MACETREALLARCADLTVAFHEAVGMLAKSGVLSKPKFQAAKTRVEETRLTSENARLMLEFHRQEHGC